MKSFWQKTIPLFTLEALFEGGRMLVGATSVTFLISRNLNLIQIAELKSWQGIVFLIAKVPTGVFADRFGRKLSLVISSLLAMVGFIVFFEGNSSWMFFIGETLTALSICFWSGAFEAYAIDVAQLDDQPQLIHRFFHVCQAVGSIAVLILGYLGGVIALRGLEKPYLAALTVYLIIFLFLLKLPDSQPNHHAKSALAIRNLPKIIWASLRKVEILFLFLIQIAMQFLIQPTLHYWQPYFISLAPAVKTSQLGLIFSIYCGTAAFFSFIYIRLSNHAKFRSLGAPIGFLMVYSFLYFIFARTAHWLSAILIFALMQGFLAILKTSLMARYNEKIHSPHRASLISSLTFISRFGMLLALNGVIPFIMRGQVSSVTAVHSVLYQFSNLAIAIGILSFLYWLIVIKFSLLGTKAKVSRQSCQS